MNMTDSTTDFSSYSSDYDSVYYDSTTVLYDSTVGDVTTVSSETEDFRGWLMSVVMKVRYNNSIVRVFCLYINVQIMNDVHCLKT